MRTIAWSPGARTAYLQFLRELAILSPPASLRAEADVETFTQMLAETPLRGRASMLWPGFRIWSLRVQHKLLVYRFNDRGLTIAGFFDMRQDLAAVHPE